MLKELATYIYLIIERSGCKQLVRVLSFINCKEGEQMKDNRTKQLCEICKSHIIFWKENGRLIHECSYCGHRPEDIDEMNFDDDDFYEE